MQKIIGTIYESRVTKIYNDKGQFVCTFVVEYKGTNDKQHKMSVYAMNIEPHFGLLTKSYLFEIDVRSTVVTNKNGQTYIPNVRVLSMQELTNDLEINGAEEIINQWYKELNKLPYVYQN